MPYHELDPSLVSSLRANLIKDLSDEQRAVATEPLCGNRLVVCEALAGAGKTTTVAAAVASVVLDVDVHRVIVITSMRSAAATAFAAINDQLVSSGMATEGIVMPKQAVRTVHSLALAANRIAGRPSQITTAVNALIAPALDEYISETINNDVRMYQLELAGEDALLAEAGFREKEKAAVCLSVAEIRTEVLSRGLPLGNVQSGKAEVIKKIHKRLVDNGETDQCQSILDFAMAGESVVGPNELLVVDEAQDLTHAQCLIVMTALRAGACVLLVGDSSQGITHFAGADLNPIYRLKTEAAAAGFQVAPFRLSVNYRSTQQILDASGKVLPLHEQAARFGARATRNGPPVTTIESTSEEQEAKTVADKIDALIAKGTPPGDIAVVRLKNFGWTVPLAKELRAKNINFSIRGKSKDTSSPNVRILAALQVAVGLQEMTADLDEQLDTLQLFVRSIAGATFADEIRPLVKKVAAEQHTTLLDAFLNQQDAMLTKFEAEFPTPDTGKRDVLGRPVPGPNPKKQNLQKSMMLAKLVFLHMQLSLDALALSSPLPRFKSPLFKKGKLVPEQRDAEITGNPIPEGLQAPRTALGYMAAYLYTDALKLDGNRVAEAQGLLIDLDAHADQIAAAEEEFTVPVVSAIVSDCVNKLTTVGEKNSVTLSTIHQFKGSERDTIFALDMGANFDAVWIKSEKLHAYDGLHMASCRREPGCHCNEFANKKKQLEAEAKAERKHLAHVALSRAKENLVVSFVEGVGEVGAALSCV